MPSMTALPGFSGVAHSDKPQEKMFLFFLNLIDINFYADVTVFPICQLVAGRTIVSHLSIQKIKSVLVILILFDLLLISVYVKKY